MIEITINILLKSTILSHKKMHIFLFPQFVINIYKNNLFSLHLANSSVIIVR